MVQCRRLVICVLAFAAAVVTDCRVVAQRSSKCRHGAAARGLQQAAPAPNSTDAASRDSLLSPWMWPVPPGYL
jgi:hypothetical protein